MRNEAIETEPGVYRVTLTQGKFALIDAADLPKIAPFRWCAYRHRNSFYAGTRARRPDGGRCTVDMHRLILGAPKGVEVDHRDNDGLNNRRENLLKRVRVKLPAAPSLTVVPEIHSEVQRNLRAMALERDANSHADQSEWAAEVHEVAQACQLHPFAQELRFLADMYQAGRIVTIAIIYTSESGDTELSMPASLTRTQRRSLAIGARRLEDSVKPMLLAKS